MEWYKYQEEQYANAMLSEGNVCISEMSVFRNVEQHGKAVGDEFENTKITYSSDIEPKTHPSHFNSFERDFLDLSNFAGAVFLGCVFQKVQSGPKYFAFCVSGSRSREIMEKMSEENLKANKEPYNSCVQIVDANKFVKAMKRFLYKKHGFTYVKTVECKYVGRKFHWQSENDLQPIELKDEIYQYQKEYRILFTAPDSYTEDRLITKIPQIKKFLKIVSV